MENTYKNLKEKAYKVALKFKGSRLEEQISSIGFISLAYAMTTNE
ncbi:MAG: hypothetical protein P8H13_04660 [Polaribacter sp.]|nr:hypothetical protein [Polaribacter sp.]MDG1811211.1 hypothetical protein [Polaribacter sp.]